MATQTNVRLSWPFIQKSIEVGCMGGMTGHALPLGNGSMGCMGILNPVHQPRGSLFVTGDTEGELWHPQEDLGFGTVRIVTADTLLCNRIMHCFSLRQQSSHFFMACKANILTGPGKTERRVRCYWTVAGDASGSGNRRMDVGGSL